MNYVMSERARTFVARARGVYIDGQPRAGSSGEALTIFNPSTDSVLCEFFPGSREDVDKAARSARRAFDDGRWRFLPPAAKCRILLQAADLIDAHAEELAELEMLDAGKLHHSALEAEVPFAAECFRYHAGWCTKLEGTTKHMSLAPPDDFLVYSLREPIGVAGLIVPSTGLVGASWKLAPAGAGCCYMINLMKKPLSTLL
jgi:acyl-CoA reductase-like NAD-dependent aldehyde dehydrogenase